MLEASHPNARLQFDMKDDLDRIGSRGADHLAELFKDRATSPIFNGDCRNLIATLANRLAKIRRGIDPTDRLLLACKSAGLTGVESSLIAEMRGPSRPEMIYLAWPLLLQLQMGGLDLVALCHAKGKQVDAWTYTPQGMQLAQPSGIAVIGLPARHVLGVAGVHKDDLKPMLLKNLKGGDPIDPGGLHRD